MIRCPNCTAQLEFDTSMQKVRCQYCGSTFNQKELEVEAKKSKEVENPDTYEGKSYICSQCGATLLTFEETAITFCSYCGSQAMIESKLIRKNNPQFIIPFKKTKEECIEAYKKKIKRHIFIPSYMKKDIVVNKFRGIYIPYCVYKLSFHDDCDNYGKKYSHRRGDYIYYDDFKITAKVDADYEGISYDMVSDLYDSFTQAIPHDYKEAEPFNINYLAGFYADTAEIDEKTYDLDAKKIVIDDSTKHLIKEKEFSKYGCNDPKIKLKVSERKTGMFPLYFLAIRDKKERYINYAIVNGQTGKLVIDLPVDFKKYIFFSLLLTIPIFLFLESSLVLTPRTITIFSVVAAIISLIISFDQVGKMYDRENHINDKGYLPNKYNYVPKYPKIKSKYYIKQIACILIAIFFLIADYANDIYYYGSSIIIFCLVIWSFYDLVKEHNLIVSNKLPQLEKRGGSENE